MTPVKKADTMNPLFKIQKSILVPFLSGVMLVFLIGPALAKTPKQQYISAEGYYKKLRNNEKLRGDRDNWITCIKKFQTVYLNDPNGPWAAAGLYMSGNLYWELYLKDGFEPDKKEAVDTYERIIKRFPKSSYRNKARKAIDKIREFRPSGAGKDHEFSPKIEFYKSYGYYENLKKSRSKRKYRSYWQDGIDQFDAVYQYDKKGPWAAAGLYMMGVLYEELARYSFNEKDKEAAAEIYLKILTDYPDSRYHRKAYEKRLILCRNGVGCSDDKSTEKDEISTLIHKSGGYGKTDKDTIDPTTSNGRAVINELRYWSNPSYTRIVVDADRQVIYEPHLLKKDLSIKKPPRLYLDVKASRLSKDIKKDIPIDDNLLLGVRAGQYTTDDVRVVIDIKSFESYKIFHLQEPFRIVIDVWGDKQEIPVVIAKQEPAVNGKMPTSALARQLALGVSRVVVDAGHGGDDPGAVGYQKNVYEKDVVLKIAKVLANKIRKRLNCEVLMTRDRDKFLTLEGRTAFANTTNADLFISIHANAHRNRSIYGLETFYLNLATDDESIRVAARENATSTKNISDLHSILSDLMQNAKINESSRLATHVQDAMYKHLKKKYSYIKNNGVKQAPFYVLLGAQMPAILIETSFISNPRECKRLLSPKYHDQLCDAIVNGIENYVKETNPTKISNIKQKIGTTG